MTSKSCFLMPTLNSAETVAETLASLIATSRSEASKQVDLVILDGGSNDLTRSICRHYRRQRVNLLFHSLPGAHPGERINQFIESGEYDYALICHSDDIYDADARLQVLEEMVELGHWVRGSMHGFFQSPLDALLQQKRNPYTGHHGNYPTDPIAFRAEIPLWWSISLNTACYNLRAIARSGIRYDWQRYTYAADYYFHYQLSQHGPCASSPRITTITRHDSRSDGPAHADQLNRESREIRSLIAEQSGLLSYLDQSNLSAFLDLNFCHGTVLGPGMEQSQWLRLSDSLSNYYKSHNLSSGASRVMYALNSLAIKE
jgi:glycosyltransferase involved in cell wall biosynthesis